jgi:hypothetical protein
MKKVWIFFGALVISTILTLCLIGFFSTTGKHELDVWRTLAKTNTSGGGYCFARQRYTSVLFGDVEFGYIKPSGAKYFYPLEIDGFHWARVRFAESNGVIYVWRGPWKAAVFDPGHGCFTNLVTKYTFSESNALYTGSGSNFFELDDPTNRSKLVGNQ